MIKKIILLMSLIFALVSCGWNDQQILNDTETLEIPESDTPNF